MRNVRRGDRVYVHARPGTTVRGVDFPTGARTFARYYLLPAIVVERPEDATVVVGVGRNPRELGLTYKSQLREDAFYVSRIEDPSLRDSCSRTASSSRSASGYCPCFASRTTARR